MTVDTDQDFDTAFSEASKPATTKPVQPVEPAAAPPAPAAEKVEVAAPAPAAPAPEVKPVSLEELQAQLLETQHRERSSANRVSVFMRENNQLKGQVEEFKKRMDAWEAAKAAAPTAPAPEPDDQNDALADAPDLRKAVERRVEKATAELRAKLEAATKRLDEVGHTTAEFQQSLEPIRRRDEQQQYTDTFTALDKQFTAAWRDTVKSAGFMEWLGIQPQRTQDLYEHAVAPADCADVLTLYYAKAGAPKTDPQPPAPAPAAPAGSSSQDRLRLAAGIAPRGNARPSTVAADDFDGAFAQALKEFKT